MIQPIGEWVSLLGRLAERAVEFERDWDNVDEQQRRRNAGSLRPAWAIEDTHEVAQLRAAERRITAATGWNSSTIVVSRILQRLRGDENAS